MGQLAWHHLVHGGWDDIAARYVFDARPLTNNRPYFAAYVKPLDLPRVTDRLELLQDEWGYLLLWATLGDRLHHRPLAGADPGRLRLAHDLQLLPGQIRSPSSISRASAPATSWSRSASSPISSWP